MIVRPARYYFMCFVFSDRLFSPTLCTVPLDGCILPVVGDINNVRISNNAHRREAKYSTG